MSLFSIKENKLDINLEYVLFHKEFADIYKAYPHDEALKIFQYIYERCDYKSYSNKQNYTTAKAHDYALKISKLSDTFVIDPVIKAAMKLYKKHNYNINAELLKDLKSTLELSVNINERIHKALRTSLDNDKLEDTAISTLITLQTKLFEVIDGLPTRITKVKQLEELVYSELAKPKVIARGGEEIPDSYEGDPEVEGLS